LKLPAKFPGERDVQTISSTAKVATIRLLKKRWVDDPRKRVNVGRPIPLGRVTETGEVGGVFAFLASDANDHPTSNSDLADLVTYARIPGLKMLSSKFGQVRRFTRILARQNGIESIPPLKTLTT
jgi:hypothetical protein